MEKLVCFTLDLEKDYGWLDTFTAAENIDPLLNLFKKYNIKLSVFLSGHLIDEYPEVISKLQKFGCDFGVHSYYHISGKKNSLAETREEVQKSQQAFINYFNSPPEHYRFPQGYFTDQDLDVLKEFGFKNNFSLFPFYRPGVFNNASSPMVPFKQTNGILEFPFAVTPKLRFPISQSYIQFLGWHVYKIILKLLGLPHVLIFDFHLHNLSKIAGKQKLPLLQRIFYIRNQGKGLKILEKFIKYILAQGYKSAAISELANDYQTKLR
ncbi:MAG: hypothetical protein CMI53_03310 [Parcubacteria group bacterium]|nr:hypothetical protein [Parcubacteria group bacterium]|tara:strand:- start:9008 stop:9805 length:798 start_codon:yes stop_codon:yes gene_type:complete